MTVRGAVNKACGVAGLPDEEEVVDWDNVAVQYSFRFLNLKKRFKRQGSPV